ncbi:MAG TPA: glycosyltransferase family 39 protein [Candidatus Acidoferrales bacterium]|nr:glycosyltransferase family 39 protein [Candidatus Acidoferrales bacterium]
MPDLILRKGVSHLMRALPKTDEVSSLLRSPTLAVVTAYALRMFLMWLSHQKAGEHLLPVTGLEAGMLALSLASGKGFFGPFPGYAAPTAWLAPGYPAIWALAIRLTHIYSGAIVLLAQTINCAFSAMTCWPIFSIGKKLFGEKVGLASCWLWVFLPFSILMSLEWTWDQCVTAFLLALIVDFTFRVRDSMSALRWAGYGLLGAAAALVNPAASALLPFLFAWLIWARWKVSMKSPMLYAQAALMFFLAVLPWSIRNYHALHGWVFVKSNFGDALYVGNHPASFAVDPQPMINSEERARLISEGEPQFNKNEEHLAVRYIESHPGEFVKKTGGRVIDTWTAVDNSFTDRWVSSLHLVGAEIFFCVVFSLLSFAGLVLALRANSIDPIPLAICLILFPAPYYISLAEMRYRHPLDPILTVLTAYVVSRIWQHVSERTAVENLQTSAAA